MALLITVLAVFAAWEFVLFFLPEQTPPILHPLLVAGLAYGSTIVDPTWLLAVAVAGAVGILHSGVRLLGGQGSGIASFRLPRRSQQPAKSDLRGVGKRIPGLP